MIKKLVFIFIFPAFILFIITGCKIKSQNLVTLKPGDDIQSVVNNNPAGTTYSFTEGIYRMQVIIPKDRDIFDGQNKAVLNGSRLLTEWNREGRNWFVAGQTQQGFRNGEGRELHGHPRASYPEDLFVDDVPLLHAEHIGDVKPGTFFFDYQSDRIYISFDPAGHKIETGISDQSFKGNAKNVIIRNMVIEKYASPAQWGTISFESGLNWLVENNTIQWNHGCGVNFGNGSKILNNKIINNGHAGFGGEGKDWVFENNDVINNGWAGIDPVWEGGGGKVTFTTGGIFRGNRVNGNFGPGIWLDIDANNILIEENLCVNNSLGPGIMFEISSGAIIRNNTCGNNGAQSNMCQIYISSSSNSKVYGNTIDVPAGGGEGLVVVNMHRPPSNPGINNEIYSNNIILRGGGKAKVGVLNENEADSLDVFTKNSFHNNTYHLDDLKGKHFMWDGKTNYTFAETQAAGHEAESTSDTFVPVADPQLATSENKLSWPELTEPPFDKSLLNPDLEAKDASPALWFRFDEKSGTLANDFSGRGKIGLLQEMDESTSHCTGISGNALNFDGKNDNVKAGPLGMFRYLTISMWVNPENIEKEFNALVLTDGWKKGTVHFMISGSGRLQFSLNGNQNTDRYSEKIFNKEDIGKWKHVAVVYDAESKTINFYINGKLNATRNYSKAILANMGDFQIGGWEDGGRNFCGKIDDVSIYGRCLSEDEIAKQAKLDN